MSESTNDSIILQIAKNIMPCPGDLYLDEMGRITRQSATRGYTPLDFHELGRYVRAKAPSKHLEFLVLEYMYDINFIGSIGGAIDVIADAAYNKNITEELKIFYKNTETIKTRLTNIFEKLVNKKQIHTNNMNFLKEKIPPWSEYILKAYKDACAENSVQ